MSASGCVSKWVSQLCLELGDLSVQRGDDMDRGSGGGPEGCSDRGGCGELFGAQDGLNLERSGVDIALSSSGFECRTDLGQAQSSALLGSRCAAQDCQGVSGR